MLSLIAVILFGLVITYFAMQNPLGVTLRLMNYQFTGIPVYLIVVISVISGIVMSWVIHLLNSFSFFLKLRGKEDVIRKEKRTIDALRKDVQNLKVENAHLKGEQAAPAAEEQKSITEDRREVNHRPFIDTLLHPHI